MKAAEQGIPDAMGWCYYHGKGKVQDYQKAIKYFKEAAEENHSDLAMYYLGECYLNGYGTFKNTDIAIKWYKKSAEAEYTLALLRLGDIYSKGINVEKDITESKKWYQKAADLGSEEAKKELKTSK